MQTDIRVVLLDLGLFVGEGRLRRNDGLSESHIDNLSPGRKLLRRK